VIPLRRQQPNFNSQTLGAPAVSVVGAESVQMHLLRRAVRDFMGNALDPLHWRALRLGWRLAARTVAHSR
jgi:hypothetical protein